MKTSIKYAVMMVVSFVLLIACEAQKPQSKLYNEVIKFLEDFIIQSVETNPDFISGLYIILSRFTPEIQTEQKLIEFGGKILEKMHDLNHWSGLDILLNSLLGLYSSTNS